jgi:hypothetical protein
MSSQILEASISVSTQKKLEVMYAYHVSMCLMAKPVTAYTSYLEMICHWLLIVIFFFPWQKPSNLSFH